MDLDTNARRQSPYKRVDAFIKENGYAEGGGRNQMLSQSACAKGVGVSVGWTP
jgi:hypothetical protein